MYPNGCDTACADAFLTKVNTAASGAASLVYSTYLGGLGYDEGTAIAVDSNGIAYLTGVTCAPTYSGTSFPTTDNSSFTPTCSFLAQTLSGATFITELDPTKAPDQALVHSSYFGDPLNGGSGNAIAVDSSRNVFVVGDGGTPALVNPFILGYTGFLVKLDPSWNQVFSTTFPGTAWGVVERGGPAGIAVDSSGNAYITSIADPSFPAYNNLGSHLILCSPLLSQKSAPTVGHSPA